MFLHIHLNINFTHLLILLQICKKYFIYLFKLEYQIKKKAIRDEFQTCIPLSFQDNLLLGTQAHANTPASRAFLPGPSIKTKV